MCVFYVCAYVRTSTWVGISLCTEVLYGACFKRVFRIYQGW